VDYTLRDFLIVIFRRRRIILAFSLAVMCTVLAAVLLRKPEYTATAGILVRKARAEMPLSPTVQGEPIIVQVSEEDLNSEIEILRNQSLIEQVIQDLPPLSDEPPSVWASVRARAAQAVSAVGGIFRSQQLSELDMQVLEAERNLAFQPIARSNVIELSYRSQDPAHAAAFLSALIDRYLARRIEVHQPSQLASFFDQQAEAARQHLLDAETTLQQFMQDSAIAGPVDSETQLALQTLDTFERQLAQARVDVEASEGRVAVLEESLQSVPERLPTAYRENQAPETEEITRAITQLTLERDDLLTRGYSENNSRVRDLAVQISLARRQLEEAEARVGGINRTEINQVHQDLKSALVVAQSELEASRAQYQALQAQVSEFRSQVAALNRKGFTVQRLRRDVSASEETYLMYRRRQEETQATFAMDQENIVSVSVAREPRRPLRPTGPSKRTVLLSGFILAAIGGLGVGFVVNTFDRTLTTPEDVERRLGLRHLTSIPRWAGHDAPHASPGGRA